MIFRLSQKLGTKIKAGTLHTFPLDENPFADWSSHVFVADRTQYVILCNTTSLYSTVMFAKGITSGNEFITRAVGQIREFMEDDGQEFIYHRLIAPSSSMVRFAKPLNRSITGSMNDLIYHAKIWLTEGELAPHDVGFKLNDIPFSTLAGDGAAYRKPREAFKSLPIAIGPKDRTSSPQQSR
jgi:hypothetical protein